jgi:hypothetical protein
VDAVCLAGAAMVLDGRAGTIHLVAGHAD